MYAQKQQQQQEQQQTAEVSNEPNILVTPDISAKSIGRYVWSYCNMSCTKTFDAAKPHTNERSLPCDTCGIAFKTKSNMYKHCRSQSHAACQRGIELPPDADDGLSDQDADPELSNSGSELNGLVFDNDLNIVIMTSYV
ncbi:hypothetical protein GQX74_010760 [Glossina fuscipes]|nr:hypothetical protein GQX74_010760 [Glossina fuscipes]